MSRIVEFDLCDELSAKAFAMLCRNLNEAGVPYGIIQDMFSTVIRVEISTGY